MNYQQTSGETDELASTWGLASPTTALSRRRQVQLAYEWAKVLPSAISSSDQYRRLSHLQVAGAFKSTQQYAPFARLRTPSLKIPAPIIPFVRISQFSLPVGQIEAVGHTFISTFVSIQTAALVRPVSVQSVASAGRDLVRDALKHAWLWLWRTVSKFGWDPVTPCWPWERTPIESVPDDPSLPPIHPLVSTPCAPNAPPHVPCSRAEFELSSTTGGNRDERRTTACGRESRSGETSAGIRHPLWTMEEIPGSPRTGGARTVSNLWTTHAA